MSLPEVLINEGGALVEIYREYLPKNTADQMFEDLKSEVPWVQHTMHIYGRTVNSPRLNYAYGSTRKHYYSGTYIDVHPWRPDVQRINNRLNRMLETRFNSCLLNYYPDGQSYIAFHSDAEMLDNTVATVSLGGSRDFHMKSKIPNSGIGTIKTTLHSGDLMVMSGTTQDRYTHGVPKRAKAYPRISLTFRNLPEVD